jgi:hypothetical protein
MASYAPHRYSPASSLGRWLSVGFIAGGLGVLVFHQGALGMLHSMGITPNGAYSMKATAPWGIPQVWSLAFWGGAWGVVLAAMLRNWDGPRLVIAATAFGAIAPTLCAWFIAAPLKGQPMAAGFVPAAMAAGLIVNAAWGLGTGIGLNLFGRPHARGLRI